jgi:SSS family solute:Na+ symporter
MQLRALDLTVLIVYLVGMTAVGWYFGRKQKDIRDYFLSDKNVPWWALAGSIVATETSTVTFISVPAFAFTTNFTFLQLVTGYMIGRVLVVLLFIPQYFKGELFTVYQLLERRFGGTTKRVAATLFLVTRSVADGIRLYATAIVLVALTGWSDITAILIVGVVTIVYTYIGGMAAVIWTDVAQLVVYLVGGAAGKFHLLDFTVSLSKSYTFWSGIIGGAFLTTATHGTDQLMVQRYLCSKSPRQAAGALLSSGALIYAQFVLFLLIGVMLYVFYNSVGAPAIPAEVTARADRIFPHFIVTQLPAGVVGLVIAAILAAAMSTLSSSLNSSAVTALKDFYEPLFAPGRSDAHYLQVSKGFTAMWGIVQIIVAVIAIQMSRSIVDAVLSIASFTSGPVLGLFLLGTLTKRVGQRGAVAGVVTGIAFMLFVWLRLNISWQWYVLLGSSVTFVVGSIGSFGRAPQSQEG